jgi:hypothetical protein
MSEKDIDEKLETVLMQLNILEQAKKQAEDAYKAKHAEYEALQLEKHKTYSHIVTRWQNCIETLEENPNKMFLWHAYDLQEFDDWYLNGSFSCDGKSPDLIDVNDTLPQPVSAILNKFHSRVQFVKKAHVTELFDASVYHYLQIKEDPDSWEIKFLEREIHELDKLTDTSLFTDLCHEDPISNVDDLTDHFCDTSNWNGDHDSLHCRKKVKLEAVWIRWKS